jgi:hypothetical protein
MKYSQCGVFHVGCIFTAFLESYLKVRLFDILSYNQLTYYVIMYIMCMSFMVISNYITNF